MAENRQYDHEYKVQAVKLAKEIGQAKAAKELGVPKNTMYGWVRANRLGSLDLGAGSQTPQSAMTLNGELLKLRRQVKELEKENRRLKKENDFLEEAGGSSILYIWLEGIDYDELEYGDLLLGQTEWERGVPVDFPFEESEEYSLTLALPEGGEKQGELRLYDKAGEILQRIPYGTFTEQVYYIIYRDNRKNLVCFPDEESNAGLFLEWNGSRFSEREMDIKRDLLLYGDLLLTQESETDLTMEIYRRHPNERISEEIRRFTLQKDTGELEIWDCLDRKNVFQGVVSMGEDGKPVNEEYYQILFTEGVYAWLSGGKDSTVPVDLWSLRSSAKYSAEYESREEFLSDYGFAGSAPIYEFYDRMDNLRLERYG